MRTRKLKGQMPNDEFESWLSLVGRLIGLSERQRKQISEELRDHLESRVADLVDNGVERQAAILQAVEEFGDASVLAKSLQSVSLRNRKRWMMRFTTLATAALFLVAVLTMAMWPEKARFGSPAQAVADQQDSEVEEDKDGEGSDSRRNREFRKGFEGYVYAIFKSYDKDSDEVLDEAEMEKMRNKPDDSVDADEDSKISKKELLDFYLAKADDVSPFSYSPEEFVEEEMQKEFGGSSISDSQKSKSSSSGISTVTVGASRRTEANNKIRELLDRPVDLVCDTELFGDVREELSRDLGINIVLDANLEDLDDDTELTANLISLPLSRSLRVMLKPVYATYVVKDGVLLIISVDDELEPDYLSRRMFEVSDLLELIKQKESDRIGASTASVSSEDFLVSTIMRVVSPDVWNGCCGLTCIGGVMVVSSSEQVAEQVEDFLADLKYQLQNRN